jgi:alkylhydroperoxidase/carboxymuconolactone decarboxylase family protein YurZ
MSQPHARAAHGAKVSKEVLGFEIGGDTPFAVEGRAFAFGEVWGRPGLDKRSRLWITLACVCAAGYEMPIRIYLNAALDAHGVPESELREFVLQFAAYQGFPRASRVEFLLNDVLAERASKQV